MTRRMTRSRWTMPDYETCKKLFLKVDITKAQSVKDCFPLIERKGQVSMVPADVRGASAEPMKMIEKILEWRNMSQKQQEKAKEHYRKHKDTKAAKQCHANIKTLAKLRDDMINNIVQFEEVVPRKTPFEESEKLLANAEESGLEVRTNQPATTTTAVSPTPVEPGTALPVPAEPTITPTILIEPSADSSSDEENDENTPPAPPANIRRKRTRTISNVDIDEEDAEEDAAEGTRNYFIGLASSKEDRMKEAKKQRQQGRNDSKRKVGDEPTAFYHLNDATTNKSFQSTLKEVGKFSNGIKLPQYDDRVDPGRACLFIDVNFVKDTPSGGGRIPTNKEMQMKMPTITVAGNTDHIPFVMHWFTKAMKHHEGDPSRPKVADVEFLESRKQIDNFVNTKKQSRQGLSRTNVPLKESVKYVQQVPSD